MSVFERHDAELGRFSVRPLVLEADAEMVHGWVTDPAATFWPTPSTATLEEVTAEYREVVESPWHDAFIGLHEGRPTFLVERYQPAHDELGKLYDVREGDVGMHFFVAPTDRPVHGFTYAVIATVMEFVFSDPAVRRVVVEPDVCNRSVQALNEAVGFRVEMIVAMSYKEALLSTCTREQYQAARQARAGARSAPDARQAPARAVVAHLDPERWAQANRLLVGKALAEFSHERLLAPRRVADERYVVSGDDGAVTYEFAAALLALDHWQIDVATITRRRAGVELELDAVDLVLDLRETLGLAGEQLGLYLEEITSTLSATAFKLASAPMSAAELAAADFQTIESRMVEGHPCFVANSGRMGFDAADFLRYAPEAAAPVRLTWVAAHRDLATFSASEDIDERRLLEAELGGDTLARFERTLREQGLRREDYHLIPVHPWQWRERLAVTFAADIARRRLVYLGQSDDEYLAQQSIRTFFNTTDPSRHYVKTALSVVNMGFVRGLSAKYMKGTPAINDWVARLVAGDEALRETGLAVLRERAAVGYANEQYEAADILNAPYSRMLAALWRESPVPLLRPGERLATMASLLHVDADGRSLAAALIERSGLAPAAWLRRYLDAYLRPLLHCFYAHQLVFMPHGENIILVLEDDVPRRVILKDIGEEAIVMDPDVVLPAAVRRIYAEVPDELRALSILTDVLDCFLRFLNAILVRAGTIDGDELWAAVATCVHDYQRSAPHLADRFATYDLFAERFALSCLNRLQLRDSRQMVNLQDPAGSLQFAGYIDNPLARFAGRDGDGDGHAGNGDRAGARARHEAALEALAEAGAVHRAGGRLADVGGASGDIRAAAAGWDLEVLSFAEPAAAELGLEPAGFDIVHCSWALHRLAAPSAELGTMARATRPGGQVVLQWSLTPSDGHAHALQDVCLQLREHGLEIAIAEEDVEYDGIDGYAGRVVAHRPAPDPAVRPPRVRAFPLAVGLLEVVEAAQLSPNMRRLVLAGEEVAELPAQEPGEIITLIWPMPGRAEIVLPQLRRWRFPEGGREQPARNLTIRALDRARGRITVDFFLHDEDGPASGWARRAAPGDVVGFGGPRAHWVTDPAADWTLLVGDETALPAIGAIIEQRPAGHRTIAVVEVEGAAEEQALAGACDLDLHWLHRGERPPGCGRELVDTVAALELPAGGRAQAWAAGESLLMRGLREHLRDDRGVPRECLSALGYWKRG